MRRIEPQARSSFALSTAEKGVELIERAARRGDPFQIILGGGAHARKHRRDTRGFGARELAVGDVERVNDLGERAQARIAGQARAEQQRLEAAPISLMGEFRIGHVEAQFPRRGHVRPAIDEAEPGLGVDEAADQPGTGDAIDMDAAAGDPGPARQRRGRDRLCLLRAADVGMRVAAALELGDSRLRILAPMRAEEIEHRNLGHPLPEPGDIGTACRPGLEQAPCGIGDLGIFGIARRIEQAAYIGIRLADKKLGDEQGRLAPAGDDFLDQGAEPCRSVFAAWQDMRRILQRNGADRLKTAPYLDPLIGRLGRQLMQKHQPFRCRRVRHDAYVSADADSWNIYIMTRLTLAVLGTLLATAPAGSACAQAQDGLSVSGSVRLRYETIAGQARAGFNSDDTLFNVRSQILAEYRDDGIRVGAELYDSRAYGADPRTPISTNEVNALELVQAYVAGDIARPFGKGSKLSLTAGRMTLNLGSRRLVAADDYRNTTNGYTGMRADLSVPGGIRATLIYTLPQLRLPDGARDIRDNKVQVDRESFDLVLWGGLVSRAGTIGPAMGELSYFHLGERDAAGRPTRDRSLDTFGARVLAEPGSGKIDYEVEAIYQTGEISVSLAPTAATLRVSATFIHADMGYTFAHPWKPRLSLEFDRASGDKSGGRYGRFDTLFGMRRADLAPAGLYNAVGRANIATPGLRLEASPGKRIDWFAAYRPMWLASDEDSFSTTAVRDATGRAGDFAGHQIEARMRYWLIPSRVRFEANGLLLAKGRFLRDAPNAPPERTTRYLSLNATASF
jgi:hypothetical protein